MTTKRAFLLVFVTAALAIVAMKILGRGRSAAPPALDEVDEWGKESFPASDPPSHW